MEAKLEPEDGYAKIGHPEKSKPPKETQPTSKASLHFPTWPILSYGFMTSKWLPYFQALHLHSKQKEKRGKRKKQKLVPSESIIIYWKTRDFLQTLPHTSIYIYLPSLGYMATQSCK